MPVVTSAAPLGSRFIPDHSIAMVDGETKLVPDWLLDIGGVPLRLWVSGRLEWHEARELAHLITGTLPADLPEMTT